MLDIYKNKTYEFFKWRYECRFVYKLALAFCFAMLTGLLAQVKIYLPFTPVPITAQTFGVLLSGVMLGARYGAASQGIYASLGIIGVPWFAGWRGGISILTSATAGYIAGFIFAAGLIGWFIDRYVKARGFAAMFIIMLIGTSIIYIPGAIYLALLLHLNLEQALVLGVLPFIPGDIFKALIAANIASALTPKKAYNGEVDPSYKPKNWFY
ncbi:MAG: biotin transporter BioY [Methanocellales archaeon]